MTKLKHRLIPLALLVAFTISGLGLFPKEAHATFSYYGVFTHMPTTDGGDSGSGITKSITPPASMTSGQLVVVYANYFDFGADVTITVSETGGQTWTTETQTSQNEVDTRIFWTIYNGTWSANPSFTLNEGGAADAFTIYGVVFNATDPEIDVAYAGATHAASASLSRAAVNTTVDNALVIGGFGQSNDNTIGSWAAGWTNPNSQTQWRNTRGDDNVLGIAYKVQASAGTTGTLTATASGSDPYNDFIIAFREATVVSSPTVTTDFATNVGPNYATLNGTKTGGEDATQHGFAYSTDSALVTSVSTTTLGALTTNTPFSSNISSLTNDTTYYFRAYATGASGTGYGVIRAFVVGNSSVSRKLRLFKGATLRIMPGGILKINR